MYISALAITATACNSSEKAERESDVAVKKYDISEIDGLFLPEGAVRSRNYVYVSNVGKHFNPLDKDGDGFISRHNLDGTIDSLYFIPVNDTLHSPKGMGVIGNVLYVTDIDVLKGYNLDTGEKTFSLNFASENTVLLNDIAVKDDSNLFVSAMDIGKVFQVNIQNPDYKLIIEKPRPNGLFWDAENKLLYLGMFGREENANGENGDIGVISLENNVPQYTQLSTYQGNIDGVTKVDNTLYFTDWLTRGDKGALLGIDLASSKIDTITTEGIIGPGDFYFDKESESFYLPKMRENKLIVLKK